MISLKARSKPLAVLRADPSSAETHSHAALTDWESCVFGEKLKLREIATSLHDGSDSSLSMKVHKKIIKWKLGNVF